MNSVKKRIMCALLSMLTVLSLCACGSEAKKTVSAEAAPNGSSFRAAMKKVDITPNRDCYLIGYDGNSDLTLCNAATDQLTDLAARILVVDNGTDRLVYLNVEICMTDVEFASHNLSNTLIQNIADACQTSKDNVLLSNTHNHQAMQSLDETQEAAILAGVEEAYAELAPAKIGTAYQQTAFGVSRGGDYTVDKTQPYDGGMSVIRFDNAETGLPIGMVYNVPIHNTMYGNSPNGKSVHDQLTCEFTGIASRTVEQLVNDANEGAQFVCMHVNGFYGNGGPLAEDSYYAASFDDLQRYGRQFAYELEEIYQGIGTSSVSGSIKTALYEDSLPVRNASQDVKNQWGNITDSPLRVKLGSFGDICYLGVNYEPFTVIGAKLKAESPFKTTVLAGNVNGWQGYIPTREVFELAENDVFQAETLPGKSPFDKDSADEFYEKVYASLLDFAGVESVRYDAELVSCEMQNEKAVYTFRFAVPTELDKVVLDFKQSLRTDCASSFSLISLDGSGQIAARSDFDDLSVNYFGQFTERSVGTVQLIVNERYMKGTSGIDELPVTVYGLKFNEK